MATVTSIPTQPGRLTVDVEDISMLRDIKKAISMLKGVTKVKAQRPKPRLYDPETGEYLNDETMKVIEDAHKGIGVTHYDSVDDMFKSILGEKEFEKIRSSHV
jgi:hypothetical protein